MFVGGEVGRFRILNFLCVLARPATLLGADKLGSSGKRQAELSSG